MTTTKSALSNVFSNIAVAEGLAPFKEGFISALDIPVRSSPDSVKMNMPKFGKVVPHRVFVGGIDNKTTEEDLREYFSSFGRITHVKIVRDRAEVSKGFGFISFESVESATKLKTQEDDLYLNGKKLNIGPAVEKSQTSFPKDVHLPPPGSMVLHPAGYASYTDQNGNTYFFPNFGAPPSRTSQRMMEIDRLTRLSNHSALRTSALSINPDNPKLTGQICTSLPQPYHPNALQFSGTANQLCNLPNFPQYHPDTTLTPMPAATFQYMQAHCSQPDKVSPLMYYPRGNYGAPQVHHPPVLPPGSHYHNPQMFTMLPQCAYSQRIPTPPGSHFLSPQHQFSLEVAPPGAYPQRLPTPPLLAPGSCGAPVHNPGPPVRLIYRETPSMPFPSPASFPQQAVSISSSSYSLPSGVQPESMPPMQYSENPAPTMLTPPKTPEQQE